MPPTRCRWVSSLCGGALLALCIAGALTPEPARAQHSKQPDPAANADTQDCAASHPDFDWSGDISGSEDATTLRCRGRYVDPLADADRSQDPARAEIEARSDATELEGDIVRLKGAVEAKQGYRQIQAEDVVYDRATGEATLLGEVQLREPGLLLRGATGSFKSETGEARLTAARFVLHEKHIRGGSDLIVRRADEIIELDDGHYTYCPPMQDQWVLQAENLELDLEEGTGTARNAKIEVQGWPVFYTPWLRFPIDDRRKSGFLWPELGSSSNGGADVATPYYFNLAPNYDATLTPRYIADRGLLTELELRYLSTAVGYWELGGAWIGGDDQYQEDFPDRDGDRWLGAIEQHGLFAQRWRTEIDFTKTGDDEYFNDLGTTALEVRQSTHLIQRGTVDYLGDDWLVTLRLEEFQTIARDITTDPYRKLPQLSLSRRKAQESFSPNLLLDSDYAYFDHGDLATGHRLYNAVGVSYPMEWIWGYLKPAVKYRQINYDLDEAVLFDGELEDTPDVGAPLLRIDSGLYFERNLDLGGQSLVQTLEPRLYYLWADYEDQTGLPDFDTSELTFSYNQLFRETRFSGLDRLDDANQVSLGLTTRLIEPASGRQLLEASLGQIHYFDDRRVGVGALQESDFEGSSAIAAEFDVSPWEAYAFRSSWLWNTDEDELDQSYLQMQYNTPGAALFNLGYSFRRYRGSDPTKSDIEQMDFSTFLPVNREWSLFFASLYDIDAQERINDMVGFEYNSCCWKTRFVFQRTLDQKTGGGINELADHESAFFVQFQLKGLGGVGTRVGGLLEEFIRGYRDTDE